MLHVQERQRGKTSTASSAASDTPAACVWKLPERLAFFPHPVAPPFFARGPRIAGPAVSGSLTNRLGAWTVDTASSPVQDFKCHTAESPSHLAAPWISAATSSSPRCSCSCSSSSLPAAPLRRAGALVPSTPPAWSNSRGAPGDDLISLLHYALSFPKTLGHAGVLRLCDFVWLLGRSCTRVSCRMRSATTSSCW